MSVISPVLEAFHSRRAPARPRGRLGVSLSCFLVSCFICAAASPAAASSDSYEPVALSERIGLEIDRAERDTYGLFPDIEGFESARILRNANGKYEVEFTRREGGRAVKGSKRVTAETLELTL